MRSINEIIIHCSDTPASRRVTVEDIREWHRARGFKDIGYHYIIYQDGSCHKGRPLSVSGAHCKGHNAHSIGVCYIGGHGDDMTKPIYLDTRTKEQKNTMLLLMRQLKRMFPNAVISGHKDHAARACPCFDAKREYKGI